MTSDTRCPSSSARECILTGKCRRWTAPQHRGREYSYGAFVPVKAKGQACEGFLEKQVVRPGERGKIW